MCWRGSSDTGEISVFLIFCPKYWTAAAHNCRAPGACHCRLEKKERRRGPLSRLLSLAQPTLWGRAELPGVTGKRGACVQLPLYTRGGGKGRAQFFPPYFCVEHRPPL